MRVLLALPCILLTTAIGGEAAPSFTKKPRASRNGKNVRIEFAVSVPVDVAVKITRNGKVIRHLAAGVLGKNPPSPLKPGLSQVLEWDGKDNAGKPVATAGCKVRVSLGMKPAFDRILGWKGEAIGEGVPGIAVDEKGHAYVLNSAGKYPTRMYVLDREGKYQRTVLPYPANLPHEKVRALPHLKLTSGEMVPVMRSPIHFAFYPEMHAGGPGYFCMPQQTMVFVGDQLVMTNPWHGKYDQVSNRRLILINKDGSIPEDYLGPLLSKERTPGELRLAPVRGEKAVYVTGLVSNANWKKAKPFNVVYKIGLRDKGPAKVYLGELNKAGNDGKHFNDPRGLAVDKHGNLYVSDWGNNRIAVFDKGGGFLGGVPVKCPGQLAIHRKTCAIYVMSVKERRTPVLATGLHKLAPVVSAGGKWVGGGKQLASTDLHYGDSTLAVDGTAEPTVIWLGHRFATPSLFRIEEKDGRFTKRTPIVPKNDLSLLVGGFLAVDRERDEVYSQVQAGPGAWERWQGSYRTASRCVRIDGRTGKMERVPIKGHTEVAVGPKGLLYVHGQKKLARFDRQGKPAPFPGKGTHVLAEGTIKTKGSTLALVHGPRGHCVGPDGRIYVLYPFPSGSYGSDHTTVDVYGPDGKPVKKKVVRGSSFAAGVQVDARGNIYVADCAKRPSAVYPPELGGQIPKTRKWKDKLNWYCWYGSLIKFPPGGGSVGGADGKPHVTLWGEEKLKKVNVKNAEWVHTGVYPMPGGSAYMGCSCFGPRFGTDGFGMSFVPDVATFSVRVVDASGNPVTRFGGYGNMDSAGPKSKIPVPEIPFAWPQYVAVSNEAVYVADVISRRIVRVKLDYQVEERLSIP